MATKTNPFPAFGGTIGATPDLSGVKSALTNFANQGNAAFANAPKAYTPPTPSQPAGPTSPTQPFTGPTMGPPSPNYSYQGGPISTANTAKQSVAAIPGFQPTFFNGQLYTDMNSLAAAQVADAHAKQQQAIGNANTAHSQAVAAINSAYKNGLISYTQAQQGIDTSRQNLQNNLKKSLNSLSGFASQASPFAYQSQQGNLENDINTQNDQNVKSLDNNQTNLNTGKSDFMNQYDPTTGQQMTNENANYQNNLTTANQGTQSAIDSINNNVQSQKSAIANAQAANSATIANNTKTYDPTSLLMNVAPNYFKAIANGIPQSQAMNMVNSTLANTGVTSTPALTNYMNSNLQPTSPFGSSMTQYYGAPQTAAVGG